MSLMRTRHRNIALGSVAFVVAIMVGCSSDESPPNTGTGGGATTTSGGGTGVSGAPNTQGGKANTQGGSTSTQGGATTTSGGATSGGGKGSSGGKSGSSGGATRGGATTASGGATSGGGAPGGCMTAPAGTCAAPMVRVTDVTLSKAVIASNDVNSDTAPIPMAIASIPSGGSRLAWLGTDSRVYVG